MKQEFLLVRVAWLHAALVTAAVIAAVAAGWSVRGLVAGGAVTAASLLLIWGMARLTLRERRRALALLASVKILLYLALLTAALTGWLVVDGEGFALGITCFVVATVVVTGFSNKRQQIHSGALRP